MTRKKGTTDLQGTTSRQMHHPTQHIWPLTMTEFSNNTWSNFLELRSNLLKLCCLSFIMCEFSLFYKLRIFWYKTKSIILTSLHFTGVSSLIVTKALCPIIRFFCFSLPPVWKFERAIEEINVWNWVTLMESVRIGKREGGREWGEERERD